jgi:protein-disulfide isomerase
MKGYLPFAIVALVALLTLAGAAALYRAKRPAIMTTPDKKIALDKDGADAMHSRGAINAPVTLHEFGDFECPPCGKLSDVINQFERDFRPHLRVVFHHFPLITHAHAKDAAYASEAAGLQGHFWEMHDLLYREQSIWTKSGDVQTLFNAYAGMLRLNVERFKKDMSSEPVKARIATDQHKGAELGVTSTPTIFLNQHAVSPASLNPTALRAEVDAAVKKVNAAPPK